MVFLFTYRADNTSSDFQFHFMERGWWLNMLNLSPWEDYKRMRVTNDIGFLPDKPYIYRHDDL